MGLKSLKQQMGNLFKRFDLREIRKLKLIISQLTAGIPMPNLVNSLTIPGNATDLFPTTTPSANTNRLGGFFSDLFYDAKNDVYYGVADRGPGGGTISYQTRVEKFSLSVNPTTGAISNFNLLQTIPFTVPAGTTLNGQTFSTTTPFNGLNPLLLNGNVSTLGLSHDPEGFAVAPNGNFYVSDEYGPSIYEFSSTGSFVRAFTIPTNLLPRKSDTSLDFLNGRPDITTGRQDNRGFEGLAISPDGTKLYGMLQDPLVNEGLVGANLDGRGSRNLRIVEFNAATGQSTAQYIYQLENIADINSRVPGNTFSTTTSQGRNIGISALTAISDRQFLVIERDNRGLGAAVPQVPQTIGSKRVYKIDLSGATDVTNVSLAGTNNLPLSVVPVSKSAAPFIDLNQSIANTNQIVPEKIEGITFGPRLADGTYAIIVGTDNDFSVTQNSADVQFDVVTNAINSNITNPALVTNTAITLNSAAPDGTALIPTFIYSYKTVAADNLAISRPTPTIARPTFNGGTLNLGTNGADNIFGTVGSDTIAAFAGDDTIFSQAGNDSIDGGFGNDVIDGGSGNDSLIGNIGNDTLIGASFIRVPTGNDTLIGASSGIGATEIDVLTGGAGSDRFVIGDEFGNFYATDIVAPGFGSYAIITDFNGSEGDLIQRSTSPTALALSIGGALPAIFAPGSATAIYAGTNLIAVVQGSAITPASFSPALNPLLPILF
jgi:hypothetical protein